MKKLFAIVFALAMLLAVGVADAQRGRRGGHSGGHSYQGSRYGGGHVEHHDGYPRGGGRVVEYVGHYGHGYYGGYGYVGGWGVAPRGYCPATNLYRYDRIYENWVPIYYPNYNIYYDYDIVDGWASCYYPSTPRYRWDSMPLYIMPARPRYYGNRYHERGRVKVPHRAGRPAEGEFRHVPVTRGNERTPQRHDGLRGRR